MPCNKNQTSRTGSNKRKDHTVWKPIPKKVEDKKMILKIHKPQYLEWWSRLYNVYKITTRSVLLIDNKPYNISGFEGRLSIVNIDGKTHKIGMREARRYRYAALESRKTVCNRIKPSNRYRHDLRDNRCDACYIRARCSMVKVGHRKRTQLAIKDAMILSQYFEENSDDR